MTTRALRRNDAGLTLIELLIAAGVFTIGMVLLMNGIISISQQSRVGSAKLAASQFNQGVFELMHGLDFEGIMKFNQGGEYFTLDQSGQMILQGIGPVTIKMSMRDPDSQNDNANTIPMSDEKFDEYLNSIGGNAPVPVEITITTTLKAGPGAGAVFKESALIYHQ